MAFLQIYYSLFAPILILSVILCTIICFNKYKEYKNSSYYQITKLPYISVRLNTGRYGEYLTYKSLVNFERTGARFLFNLYIPKNDGNTTEIDVMMICSKGIFVFESKNYSGWIFGSENQINWYQTLPQNTGKSRKQRFYNPILQNRTHIKHLNSLISEHVPVYSVIVFSERCTLKNIQVNSSDINVINRYDVKQTVTNIYNRATEVLLNQNDINNLYETLYPYTQVDSDTKDRHISNIQNSRNP